MKKEKERAKARKVGNESKGQGQEKKKAKVGAKQRKESKKEMLRENVCPLQKNAQSERLTHPEKGLELGRVSKAGDNLIRTGWMKRGSKQSGAGRSNTPLLKDSWLRSKHVTNTEPVLSENRTETVEKHSKSIN